MHFVLLADHNAEVCPTSNATTRKSVLQIGQEIPNIADKAGVRIVAGPYVNHEHLTVAVVEAESAENVDTFLVETRLPQWNTIRILPSTPLPEAIKQVEEQPPLF